MYNIIEKYLYAIVYTKETDSNTIAKLKTIIHDIMY